MPVGGYESPCPACGRTSGDHTLREWGACLGTPTTDLPFEATPDDLAGAAAERLRRIFGIEGDVIVADHVVVRALTLGGSNGPLSVYLPALLHEFQVGIPGQPPATVAQVLFTGDVRSIRGYGRLVRDSANGAVNAAERRAA